MAWGDAAEGRALTARLDAFTARTGTRLDLTLAPDPAAYRAALQAALAGGTPPDVCLIESRDFSGFDPQRDLLPMTEPPGLAPRAVDAFLTGGKPRAVPGEFSVDLLFYHPRDFDRAGLAWPGRHWTWDILEAMSRALESQQLKTDDGRRIYPLELPSGFDFWNILCTQAGHPALDRETWHLADSSSRASRLRGLDLIHEFFHELVVTAPPTTDGTAGTCFAAGRASMLMAPSEFAATLPPGSYGVTLLPADLRRSTMARVDGWAVTIASPQPDAARTLAQFLAAAPIHTGWSATTEPAPAADPDAEDSAALCHEALAQALLIRLEPDMQRLAHLLDEQINTFARTDDPASPEALNQRIENEYLAQYGPAPQRHVSTAPAPLAPRMAGPVLRDD
jgi:ABC-type glycerol-3-phosphate transport system substrate-binding protein